MDSVESLVRDMWATLDGMCKLVSKEECGDGRCPMAGGDIPCGLDSIGRRITALGLAGEES